VLGAFHSLKYAISVDGAVDGEKIYSGCIDAFKTT
jgi:hypothetical protein